VQHDPRGVSEPHGARDPTDLVTGIIQWALQPRRQSPIDWATYRTREKGARTPISNRIVPVLALPMIGEGAGPISTFRVRKPYAAAARRRSRLACITVLVRSASKRYQEIEPERWSMGANNVIPDRE